MDLADIRKLVRLMLRAELSELEIDDSNRGVRVHLKRDTGRGAAAGAGMAPVVQVMPSTGGAPVGSLGSMGPMGMSGGDPARALGLDADDEGALPAGMEVMKSPMVGTFYRASSPDAEVFVDVGAEVNEESVVCIIEAMKVMNEIKAEMKGAVAEILVENGEPVEFGQPLFLIKKG